MKNFISLFFIFFYVLVFAQKEPPSFQELLAGDTTLSGGFVQVPEDHDNPDGKKIKIAYVVLKSNSPDPGYPVILFSGGPGEITISGYRNYQNIPLLAHRDLILFDQRGTGYSNGLPNMGSDVFHLLAEDLTIDQEYRKMSRLVQTYRDSIQSKGTDLSLVNTFQNARDVGALMDHLAYEKYYFFGGSYGTQLARKTMDYFPEKIAGAILMAPATWEKDFLTFRIRNYKKALKLIFEFCENDSQCSSEYPDLREEYYSAIKALYDNPIATTINGIPFTINPQDAMYMLRYQLYTPDARERVPRFISALKNRDIEYIGSSQQFLQFVFEAVNFSMNLSVNRFEEYDPEITVDNISSYYSDREYFPAPFAFFNAFYFAGADWHNKHADKADLVYQPSSVPTLILVNKYDPVTPPENGEMFIKTLSRGQLIIQDEGGHVSDSECQIRIMMDFLSDPDKALDVSCLNLVNKKKGN